MGLSRSGILKLGGAAVAVLLEALYFLFPAQTVTLIENLTGWSEVTIVTLIMGAIAGIGITVLVLVVFLTIWQHYGFQITRKNKQPSKASLPQVVFEEPHYAPEQEDYRAKVSVDLLRIRRELYEQKRTQIQFESWNVFPKPDPRLGLINNQRQFDEIQELSDALNERNNHITDISFNDLNDLCITKYADVNRGGFLRTAKTVQPPELSTTVSRLTNARMKKIAVYFSDKMLTEHAEARFFFVSVKNLEKSRSIVGLRPAIRVISPKPIEGEISVIHAPSAPRDFITVKWPGRHEEFNMFRAPFANAFTADGGGIIEDSISLDPDQTKEFLVFFALKDKDSTFTTVKGGRIAVILPRSIEVEVYYWLKDVGRIEGTTLSINAQNWLFPEKDIDQRATSTLDFQLRVEPPVGLETIPEPERSRHISEVIPQHGDMRSQQVYVRAVNGDLVDCELKVSIDGIGIDHMLWEGIRRQAPAIAKDKVTIRRNDEKFFTLWYAHRQSGKERLYVPITTSPHMERYIGMSQPPLLIDVWVIAEGFSRNEPERFVVYRESWEGILAKSIGSDGIPWVEFDANWHLINAINPSAVSFGTEQSDRASTLHISHRGKEITLFGRMSNLKSLSEYEVQIRTSYQIENPLAHVSDIGAPLSFMTDQTCRAEWVRVLSAGELTANHVTRFSVWIRDLSLQAKLWVLVSDNLAYHN